MVGRGVQYEETGGHTWIGAQLWPGAITIVGLMPRGVIHVGTPLVVLRELGRPIHLKHVDEPLSERGHFVFRGQLKGPLDRKDGLGTVLFIRHFPV